MAIAKPWSPCRRFCLAVAVTAFVLPGQARAAEPQSAGPPFPRIGTCYGAALGYRTWDEGGAYWSKLRLIVGGCYDLHYDWDNRDWSKTLATVEQNLARLRKVNRQVIVLPYVDVIEGIDNPGIPKAWWDLNAEGKRWSGWPGYYRINTQLRDVLEYNLNKVRDEIMARPCFDGVFYDCWHVDNWLCPKSAALRDGRAVVMINDWNLPRKGFSTLNGCLAEDEFNRVMEGTVDFEDFLGRYLRWCRESRQPAVTMLVGHPRNMPMDPFRTHEIPWAKRVEQRRQLQHSDPQALRFGLCTALMGDGYFGYDCANMGRGDWWWFPEYDAPLGYPKGPARKNADGTWRRAFDGGAVIVNGSAYDAVVQMKANHRDVSSGRVSRRFTVPMLDGRILLPTSDPPGGVEDPLPRVTAEPPETIRVAALDGGLHAVQTKGGLDLRIAADGTLRNILWHGKTLCTGGWPSASSADGHPFAVENSEPVAIHSGEDQCGFEIQGTLLAGDERVGYIEKLQIHSDDSFSLEFRFVAKTDLKVRMWRHFLAFPIEAYTGTAARNERGSVTLPATLGSADLLPAGRKLTVRNGRHTVTIESSIAMGLVDHRKWGSEEYLLAGYPIHGKVKAGTNWSFRIQASVKSAP